MLKDLKLLEFVLPKHLLDKCFVTRDKDTLLQKNYIDLYIEENDIPKIDKQFPIQMEDINIINFGNNFKSIGQTQIKTFYVNIIMCNKKTNFKTTFKKVLQTSGDTYPDVLIKEAIKNYRELYE